MRVGRKRAAAGDLTMGLDAIRRSRMLQAVGGAVGMNGSSRALALPKCDTRSCSRAGVLWKRANPLNGPDGTSESRLTVPHAPSGSSCQLRARG